jgi:type I restriction enzyme, S subunit
MSEEWVETTLGKVARVQSGFPFSAKDWTDSGTPVIKIKNVRDGQVTTENCSFISEPIPDGAERFLLARGDLLITLTGEIGAIGFVSDDEPMYLNQRVGKVEIIDGLKADLQYVGLFLSSSSVRAEMWSLGKGNAQLNISPSAIHNLVITLPPLPVQRRIVDLMTHLDAHIANLATGGAVTNEVGGEVQALQALRKTLLGQLLSGQFEIPPSYDVAFIGKR